MKNNKPYPIRLIPYVLGLLVYFVGFNYILPKIAGHIILLQDPSAKYITLQYEFFIYLITFIPIFLIVKPLLIQEIEFDIKEAFRCAIICIFVMIILNVLSSIIASSWLHSTNSANQAGLDMMKQQNPFLFIVLTAILGPWVEELVFRGLIFRFLDKKVNFIVALVVSSLLFGFVHIEESIIHGNFQELYYLILYSLLGVAFAFTYKKNDSIYACILLHMLYNLMAAL